MKKLIHILVFAKNPDNALDEARKVVNEKLGTTSIGGPFVHYVDYSNDAPGLMYKSRRKQIPPVLQVSTACFPTEDKRGLKMVNSAMEKNQENFKESMALIRHHIKNYTDDQLFNEIEGKGEVEIEGLKFDDHPRFFREYCGHVYGKSQDPRVYLYDYNGRGVTSPLTLQKFLNGCNPDPWGMDERKGQDPHWTWPLWVVPFRSLW